MFYFDLETFFCFASVFGCRCCASKASYTFYQSSIALH